MIRPERSLCQHLSDNFKELLSWRIFSLPIGILLIFAIQDFESAPAAFWLLVKSPLAWLVWIATSIIDAVIRAVYWHARERKTSYIKKQEAYEKWKAEKEGAKQKGDEHSQPKD